jgi:formylglycine-generating enzyme required for sulfatase activity
MKRPLSVSSVVLVLFYLLALLDQARAQAPKEITNSIGMKLLLIPKGTFMMGSPESEERRRPQESQHDVTLSKDYFLGAYEVTQSEYQQVMNKNPSFVQGAKIRDSSRHPVEQVSWNDAVEFCKRLSELPEEKRAERLGLIRHAR